MEPSLKYIWHDSFVLDMKSCSCIFDYWKDPVHNGAFLDTIDRDKPLYVFVSHHHKDHFTRTIFTWASMFPYIRFIISKDTARAVHYILKPGSTYKGEYRIDPSVVTVLRPGEVYEDTVLRARAFDSTDTGNCYVVEAHGMKVFHAGDLNAWIWKDESTPGEIRQALVRYGKILDDIADCYEKFDLAMFPVDPRLGRDFWEGANIFTRRFKVKNFVPMHFCLGGGWAENVRFASLAIDFARYANPEYGCYCALTEPYSVLLLNF